MGLPPDVEDLPSDLRDYVRQRTAENFDPMAPIGEAERTLYDGRRQGQSRISGVNSSDYREEEVDGPRSDFRVFLSHAAFDSEIAAALKASIQRQIPGVKVFSSTDPTDLPPGSRWPTEIQQALQNTDALILVATSRSLGRPWVWFEAGSSWFGKSKLMPLCFGSVRKNALPSPLSERQAANAYDPEDLRSVFEEIARLAGSRIRNLDSVTLAQELARLEGKTAAQNLDSPPGWFGVNWDRKFLAYDGPLESLNLIEDDVFQESMSRALETGGYETLLVRPATVGDRSKEGYRLVHTTDRRSWRRKIALGDVVLLARPLRIDQAVARDEEMYRMRDGKVWRRRDIDELPEAQLRKLLDEEPDLGDWWLGKPL